MYLISIYFDEQTQKQLQAHIDRVAKVTGNTFMSDNLVPPHITVGALETKCEDKLLASVDALAKELETGVIKFVSIGIFSSQVIYAQPVLNEYLHRISVDLTQELGLMEDTICSPYYQPFSWLPHCTIAKQLSKKQQVQAFEILQNSFVPIEGKVVRIGVAKTNPHRDIKMWEINEF